MVWGIFTRDEAGDLNGSLSFGDGAIGGAHFRAAANPTAGKPNFEIYDQRGSKIGAGWRITDVDRNYISVRLHASMLNGGEPLFPVLVETAQNRFELFWSADQAPSERRAVHLHVVR